MGNRLTILVFYELSFYIYLHSYAATIPVIDVGSSLLNSQVTNHTVDKDWHKEDKVLVCISVIWISAGYTGSPKTCAITSRNSIVIR